MILSLLGTSLLLLSLFTVAGNETVIDVSFILEPGDTYGPYNNGTYHHTTVITKSTLTGIITVEGAGINFTANGYNTQHIKSIFVNESYRFVINPADDSYLFTFDNTRGSLQNSVRFTLEERWIDIVMLIPGLIGLLILVPGLILFVSSPKKQSEKESRIRVQNS